MPQLTDLKPGSGPITAIIIGRPGAGKTALASSFGRVRLFDFDKKVGAALNPAWVKILGRVPTVEFETFSERRRLQGFAAEHNAFDDACRKFDQWMTTKDSFDTFVIDSATQLTEFAYNKALKVLGGAKRSNTHDTAMKFGLAMLQKQDFGGGNSLVIQFIRMVLESNKNVIVTAHEKESTNDSGLLVSVDPMFIGQNVQAIPALFQNVWRLQVRGAGATSRRVLLCDPDGVSMARSELGLGTIDDPTYDKIISRMKERIAALPSYPAGTPPAGGTPGPLSPAKP